jgi:large subunit ribosomal protein L29
VKPAEIRAMDNDRLESLIDDLLAEWRNLRFQEAVGQLTATARIRQIRKDIARIKTIQTEREIDAELAAANGSVASGLSAE